MYTTLSCRKCGKPARVFLSGNSERYRFCSPGCKRAFRFIKKGKEKKYKMKTKQSRAKHRISYKDERWKNIRYKVLKRDGARCCLCGATPEDGVKMHVDHIKPKYLFPELKYDPDNLQVLCENCNIGKGAWDQTDWRKKKFLMSKKSRLRTLP